ncbi:hypothetical protein BMJ22_18625 [Sinorhizobium medicae]|nr:hypothetical protein BMJ22_18625 [Sinorhizobium medicae]
MFLSFNRIRSKLQRRASYQTHKGRCSTLICCMFLSFNRIRSKETCSRAIPGKVRSGFPSGIAAKQGIGEFP